MIQFKTPRIEVEFKELFNRNRRLYQLILVAGQYSEFEFRKEVTITSLYRTPEENAALYAPNVEPISKPHTIWQAVDLRSVIYSAPEIYKFVQFLNLWTVFDGKKLTAFCHSIPGGSQHFHVQCNA